MSIQSKPPPALQRLQKPGWTRGNMASVRSIASESGTPVLPNPPLGGMSGESAKVVNVSSRGPKKSFLVPSPLNLARPSEKPGVVSCPEVLRSPGPEDGGKFHVRRDHEFIYQPMSVGEDRPDTLSSPHAICADHKHEVGSPFPHPRPQDRRRKGSAPLQTLGGKLAALVPKAGLITDSHLVAGKKGYRPTPTRLDTGGNEVGTEAKVQTTSTEKSYLKEITLRRERQRIDEQREYRRKAEEETAEGPREAEEEVQRIKEAEKADAKQEDEGARMKFEAMPNGKPVVIPVAQPAEPSVKVEKLIPHKMEHSGVRLSDLLHTEGPALSLETLARSMASMEGQLAIVLKSLGDTQNRLATVEQMVVCTQADVVSGQQGVMDMRIHLSTMQESTYATREQVSRFDRGLNAVEAKNNALSKSFDQHQTRLANMQEAVGGTQQALTGMKESVGTTRHLLLEFRDKMPAVEAKLDRMGATLATSRGRMLEVENAVEQARERVLEVQDAVATHGRILLTVQPSPSNSQDVVLDSGESLDTSRRQLVGLDQRVPALEAKAEKLERAFGQTLESIASVHTSVQATQQQRSGSTRGVLGIEEKAGKFAESFVKGREELADVQSSLFSTGERLDELDMRIIAVEDKTTELEKSFDLVWGPQTGRRSFFPLDEPTLFPPRRLDNAAISPTETFMNMPLPWSPLPAPLEDTLHDSLD